MHENPFLKNNMIKFSWLNSSNINSNLSMTKISTINNVQHIKIHFKHTIYDNSSKTTYKINNLEEDINKIQVLFKI